MHFSQNFKGVQRFYLFDEPQLSRALVILSRYRGGIMSCQGRKMIWKIGWHQKYRGL